ncbi:MULTISPECIES: hypothetical protein [Fischerella]|uniref:Uncharacterized protein n=1 Tax=Fischerella muscicola CCMEE 5323 TaxID=2019572 RepID=A0A2N6K5G5_FISMU|nr:MULTISPECIES: hypothetical protein [Fischerella]MBD2434795.1 hypothetical protein [Fischerella sp. FACHB-380]PLZ91757.1 hypothetical protein CEN44_07690 [Fischerella muscicola CCMEE 5323]
MSGLKIADLSFCETEIPNDLQIQGGLIQPILMNYISDVFSDDFAKFDKHPGERSLEKETTDKFGIKHKISAKKTKNSKVVANVAQGTKNGVTYSGSTAIATSSGEL